MYKISVIGHFAEGDNCLDGQTVKTKIMTQELQRVFGENNIHKVDTHGGVKKSISLCFKCIKTIKTSENIIILPAQNGLRMIAPILYIFNIFYKRTLLYNVIGGWLPEFLYDKKILSRMLRSFNRIYVETYSMKHKLKDLEFNNVEVIPNCKYLNILDSDLLHYSKENIIKVCTFSRVMKEKGIEVAVNAVKNLNEKLNWNIFYLDIYGQIDENQLEWFKRLENDFSETVVYKGTVPFDKSVDVLKVYDALLFPTFYEGEGFAGTLIDAMAAGVPIIASDWRYNAEIVKEGINGKIIKESLEDEMMYMYNNLNEWNIMKKSCLKEAEKYMPEVALEVMTKYLR